MASELRYVPLVHIGLHINLSNIEVMLKKTELWYFLIHLHILLLEGSVSNMTIKFHVHGGMLFISVLFPFKRWGLSDFRFSYRSGLSITSALFKIL